MPTSFKQVLVLFSWILLFLVSSSPLMAKPDKGFFSTENENELKQNPTSLFSAINTCRIRSVLGKNDFDLFSNAMDEMSLENDAPHFVSLAGNAMDQATTYAGFIRISPDERTWLAYLHNNKIHYFTNDEASYNHPPQIMLNWAKRFKNPEWIYHLVITRPVIWQ